MPYARFDPDQMILRDHLAYDRTVLANERTLLSYLRTSFALFAAGGTLIKVFSDEQGLVDFGIILLAVGLVVVVVGIIRFFQMKKRIGVAYDKLEEIEEG